MAPTSQRLDLDGVRSLLEDLVRRRAQWTPWEQRRYDRLAALEADLLERRGEHCDN